MESNAPFNKINIFLAEVAEGLSQSDTKAFVKNFTDQYSDQDSIKDILSDLYCEMEGQRLEHEEKTKVPGGEVIDQAAQFAYEARIKNLNNLKDLLSSKLITNQISAESVISTEKEYNKKIFTSVRGFLIFNAFKNEVVTDATEYADYSFLFGQLMKDEFIHEMKHQKFIDFLCNECDAKVVCKYNQFKFSKTNSKMSAYSHYKKQFP